MESRPIKDEAERTSVDSLDSHERLNELFDPISQPTSVERSEDEPAFQCKGDELRMAKMTTWMVAITLILAMWLAVFYISFLFSLPLSTLILISCLILGCAVAMQLRKEKSWIKVYKDRIEWSSFSIERQAVVENSAESPFLIDVGILLNRPTVKSLDGTVLGKVPAIYGDNFIKLLAAAQKMRIPVVVNIVQPFSQTVDGQKFVIINYFDARRVLAIALPLIGTIVSIFIPKGNTLLAFISLFPVLIGTMASVFLQVGLFAKSKGRTGLLFGESTITRIKKDEVIWSLTAGDLRCLAFHANDFGIKVQVVTQYGRRHDLGVAGLHALKFALANNIPIVTEGKLAQKGDTSN